MGCGRLSVGGEVTNHVTILPLGDVIRDSAGGWGCGSCMQREMQHVAWDSSLTSPRAPPSDPPAPKRIVSSSSDAPHTAASLLASRGRPHPSPRSSKRCVSLLSLVSWGLPRAGGEIDHVQRGLAPQKCGRCASFKGHSLSPCANPHSSDSQLSYR